MTVESWDPGAAKDLTQARIARLLDASQRLDEPRFGLDTATAGELAPFARHGRSGVDWAKAASGLGDDDLVRLIRLFTLAESKLSGWEAGDASPVIALAAELKGRGRYPDDLTAWIRANSDNRFLPYGNLMKRL